MWGCGGVGGGQQGRARQAHMCSAWESRDGVLTHAPCHCLAGRVAFCLQPNHEHVIRPGSPSTADRPVVASPPLPPRPWPLRRYAEVEREIEAEIEDGQLVGSMYGLVPKHDQFVAAGAEVEVEVDVAVEAEVQAQAQQAKGSDAAQIRSSRKIVA